MTTPPRRSAWWGFRGRLAVSIAASFIVLGSALVGVQLVILSQSIAKTIDVSIGNSAGPGRSESGIITESSGCIMTPDVTDCEVSIPEDADTYSSAVASDVIRNYVVWSIVLLIVFALISAVLAWLLTRSPARKISGITALAADISEHDLSRRISLSGPRDEITELGDQIDTMLSRLDSAFTSQDQFVANASHELRTPITAIRAALEVPLTQGRVPIDLQPDLQRALRSTQRMDEMITALLLIARTRQLALHEQSEIDVRELVDGAVADTAHLASERGIALAVDAPARRIGITGNAEAVGIAVRNMVHNAVQHNRSGGEVSISLREQRDGDVVIAVANSGAVYTEAEAKELTRPFNRGHQTRLAGTPGTGLGLTIIESVALAHGARLEVRPGEQGGLVVSLTFERAAHATT